MGARALKGTAPCACFLLTPRTRLAQDKIIVIGTANQRVPRPRKSSLGWWQVQANAREFICLGRWVLKIAKCKALLCNELKQICSAKTAHRKGGLSGVTVTLCRTQVPRRAQGILL